MYSAVSGLQAHMSALNVIGHNISNVNTMGYKAARYTFNEALYTTSRFGSDGSETLGGFNPAQYGYGSSIGTIDLDTSTKQFTPTGTGLDCMIDGDGFFITGDKNQTIMTQEQLQAAKLTRLGNLEFHDGYLVDGNGNCVMGYACTDYEDELDENGDPVPPVFNHVLTPIRFPTINADTKEVIYPGAEEGESLDYSGTLPTLSDITIDKQTGLVTGIVDQSDTKVYIGYIAIGKVDNPNGVTHVDGRYYQALAGAGRVHATALSGAYVLPSGDEEDEDETTAMPIEPLPDGSEMEPNLTIDPAGDTRIIPGGLEGSGTNLANEISNMIMIQRGYQANTRIVTVTDSMLEELVNMKR